MLSSTFDLAFTQGRSARRALSTTKISKSVKQTKQMNVYISGVKIGSIQATRFFTDQYALQAIRLGFAMVYNVHVEEVSLRYN